MNKKNTGLGVFDVITLILIVLKLLKVIDLEWIVVIFPFLVGMTVKLLISLLSLLVILLR